MISELLMNKEQRTKFRLRQEAQDYGGLVRLNRIEDQTVFDLMFISGEIKQPQHEAVFLFIEALSKAGAFPPTVNYEETGSRVPAYMVGDQISMRRLAFSQPYRFVLDRCGERPSSFLMSITENIYCFPRKEPARGEFVSKVARLIADPLWALAAYYETSAKRDPRDVIGMQFGVSGSRVSQRWNKRQ